MTKQDSVLINQITESDMAIFKLFLIELYHQPHTMEFTSFQHSILKLDTLITYLRLKPIYLAKYIWLTYRHRLGEDVTLTMKRGYITDWETKILNMKMSKSSQSQNTTPIACSSFRLVNTLKCMSAF